MGMQCARCAKIQYRTCTRVTCFGNTMGIPVPMQNPTHTIMPPHSLGSQYEVCSLSVAIPVTLPMVFALGIELEIVFCRGMGKPAGFARV